MKTILVAEDCPAILELVSTMLEERGFSVIKASDGREALDKFRQHPDGVDLFLSDLSMPRMSGAEAYAEIIKIRPNIDVLFMTGFVNGMALTKEMMAEGIGFLQKPFKSDELMTAIKRILMAGVC